jgi:hypothetical protein
MDIVRVWKIEKETVGLVYEVILEEATKWIEFYVEESILITDHGYYDVKNGRLSEMQLPVVRNSSPKAQPKLLTKTFIFGNVEYRIATVASIPGSVALYTGD